MDRRQMLKLSAAGLSWGFFGLSLPMRYFLAEAYGLTPDPQLQKYDAAIQVFFDGAPSQTDTWDPKPGSPNNVFNTISLGTPDIYGSTIQISEVFPRLANLVTNDPTVKLGLIRSMTHGNGNHDSAQRWMNCFWQSPVEAFYPSTAASMAHFFTGQSPLGIPSVVISGGNGGGANDPKGGACPTAFTVFDVNSTVQLLRRPTGVDAARYARRKNIQAAFDADYLATRPDQQAHAWNAAVDQAYAITNAGTAASAFDLTGKPLLTGRPGGRANNGTLQRLTLAQELVKAGIPYVAVGIGGNDSHANNRQTIQTNWGDTADSALAQMCTNLKATGKRVLILMGGEFGRTPNTVAPNAQGVRRDGRDHYASGFSWAMLSINQPAFRMTAIGNTGPDGMWRVGSNPTLVDPVYPGSVGGLLYRALGFNVGGGATVPTAQGDQSPVDPTLATSAARGNTIWLMQQFGLA